MNNKTKHTQESVTPTHNSTPGHDITSTSLLSRRIQMRLHLPTTKDECQESYVKQRVYLPGREA